MSYQDETAGDWMNDSTVFPEDFRVDLPQPLFWRMLIAPVRPKEVSKGGIVIPVQNQETQEILNCIGTVVALGPMAGAHERLGGDGVTPHNSFPKIGDTVVYGRHAGQHLRHKGIRLIIINDDELLTTVPNPDTLAVSI
jgi:co-chaperonin GroES (HSP10)